MAARNDITLASIRTHAPSDAYDKGFDAIFGKKIKIEPRNALQCAARACDGCTGCLKPVEPKVTPT